MEGMGQELGSPVFSVYVREGESAQVRKGRQKRHGVQDEGRHGAR